MDYYPGINSTVLSLVDILFVFILVSSFTTMTILFINCYRRYRETPNYDSESDEEEECIECAECAKPIVMYGAESYVFVNLPHKNKKHDINYKMPVGLGESMRNKYEQIMNNCALVIDLLQFYSETYLADALDNVLMILRDILNDESHKIFSIIFYWLSVCQEEKEELINNVYEMLSDGEVIECNATKHIVELINKYKDKIKESFSPNDIELFVKYSGMLKNKYMILLLAMFPSTFDNISDVNDLINKAVDSWVKYQSIGKGFDVIDNPFNSVKSEKEEK